LNQAVQWGILYFVPSGAFAAMIEQANLVSQSAFVLYVTFFSRNALYCSFKALSFSLSCDFGKPVAALFFSRLWPIFVFLAPSSSAKKVRSTGKKENGHAQEPSLFDGF